MGDGAILCTIVMSLYLIVRYNYLYFLPTHILMYICMYMWQSLRNRNMNLFNKIKAFIVILFVFDNNILYSITTQKTVLY